MIEILENQRIVLLNWFKHQNEDALTSMREKTRNRVAAFRERQKTRLEEKGEGNVTVTRHKHGFNKHVLLTDDNYSELCERYGKELADEYIQKVDDYCENHGKTYSNYTNAVHTYIRNDVKRGKLKLETPIETKRCPECGSELWGGICSNRDCCWSKDQAGTTWSA